MKNYDDQLINYQTWGISSKTDIPSEDPWVMVRRIPDLPKVHGDPMAGFWGDDKAWTVAWKMSTCVHLNLDLFHLAV